MGKKIKVHVVSHTHWDREWYLPFQIFRMRLVNLMDQLLDIFEKEPEYGHFNLDGQTICIEDYLEVRPEKKEVLMQLIANGKIAIGPWYVLPDGFLTSSEALIRNLMIGDNIANVFGKKMQVGYLPDTFGHCSQIPQIMVKFGFEGVVVWRGINGEPDKLKSEFKWQGPDGSEILTVHLSDDFGYFNVTTLPEEPEKALGTIMEAVNERLKYNVCRNVLLMNGFDHYPPQYHTGKVLKTINTMSDDYEIIHSSIESYIDSVKSCSPKLETIKGEFTSTNMSERGKVNAILRNVLSSRMYLKQMDFENERLLTRYVEPLMSMAYIETGRYDSMFINLAWKYLVQNHPHDSICGCSADQVHKDMETRYSWVNNIAKQCTREAMNEIAKNADTSRIKEGDIPVHLFNTLCYPRIEKAVELVVDLKPEELLRNMDVCDLNGHILESQIINVTDVYKIYNTSDKMPESRMVKQIKFLVNLGEVKPFGYTTISACPSLKPELFKDHISKTINTMENEFLKVLININGTIDIIEKCSNRLIKGINYFIDGGDVGDEYEYSPPMIDSVINTIGLCAVITLMQNGPLMGEYSIKYEMDIPEGADEKGYCRSSNTVRNTIESKVVLRKGSRIVEFETTMENKAKDHRIRVVLPSGIQTEKVFADSHFDVVERKINSEQPSKEAWIESATAAGAQKRFIFLSDGDQGMAVLNQGIPEYEIVREEGYCTAMLTLLRCVDRIGSIRSMTMGIIPGPEARTPDAQCLGKYTMKYAVYLFPGDWIDGQLNYEAEKYHSPLMYHTDNLHAGKMPLEKSYVRIDNSNVMITALKKSENRDAVIVRLCNLSKKAEKICIDTTIPLYGVYLVNLKEDRMEDRMEDIDITSGKLQLHLKPCEIVTVELKFI